jgi:hypothetical protein
MTKESLLAALDEAMMRCFGVVYTVNMQMFSRRASGMPCSI